MTTKTSQTPMANEAFGSSTARQSSRVGVNPGTSDGAVWQEKLTVCEGTTKTGQPQVFVRSYYRNLDTMEKAWDEPPSGASAVLHATAAERQEVESQRTQLELTLQSIPDEDREEETVNHTKPKKGIFRRFRRKDSSKEVDTSKDVHLQKAIARSIREQKGDSNAADDDVELAMALSMSVQDHLNHEDSEQAMFQRALARSQRENANRDTEEDRALQEALERSKHEQQFQTPAYESPLESFAPVAAALPPKDFLIDDSTSSNMDPPYKFSEDEMDLKMPAKPKFDPYGKE